ncbi:hypothetical protein ACH4U6_35625 [Streptomyces netropsis]|uniref:hypothetical protein n=1 Tax=Streptomyces netropsis TaxID=55404 RepID=UPI0037B67AA9
MTTGIDFTKPGPAGTGGPGCCTTCPLRPTCPVASDDSPACAVTGSTPPPPPPSHLPDAAPAAGVLERVDYTEIVSRGAEAAISGMFGFGWTDLLATAIERTNKWDADGNPVDWGRLQLKRNFLCLAVATLVPLGDHTAAVWVARTITTYGFTAPLVPAGMALGVGGSVFLGQYAPGLLGWVCHFGWSAGSALVSGALKFLRSRLGWIVTRPAIWAAIGGLLIVTGRPIVRILTGA